MESGFYHICQVQPPLGPNAMRGESRATMIGVHSIYENTMLDSRPGGVVNAAELALGNRKAKKDVAGG